MQFKRKKIQPQFARVGRVLRKSLANGKETITLIRQDEALRNRIV